jgi:hypothetical protein
VPRRPLKGKGWTPQMASKILPPRYPPHHSNSRLRTEREPRPSEALHGMDIPILGELVHVDPVTLTVRIAIPIGGGAINDSAEDRPGYCATFHDRIAFGLTPETAAKAAYLLAQGRRA